MDAETWNRPRSRGMTLLEILMTVILIGSFVPATTASLSREAQKQQLNTNRELAAQLAEEGVELVIAGGFHHWYPLVRPGPAPVTPCYSYDPSLPVADTSDLTLTVFSLGRADDDVFLPFVGNANLQPVPANPMRIKPWSKFNRSLVILSRGNSNSQPPRVLECTVRVVYGPDPKDVILVPLFLGNHGPIGNGDLRGLCWPLAATTLATVNVLAIDPSPPSRWLWGKSDGRLLNDSSYPISAGYPD